MIFLIVYAVAALIKKLWHADRIVFTTLGLTWVAAGMIWTLRMPFDYLWIFLALALLLAAVFNQKLGVEAALVTATRRLRSRRRAASAGLLTTAGPATPTPPAASPVPADSSAASTGAPSNPPPEAPASVRPPAKAAEPVPEGIVWLEDFLSAPEDLRGLTVGAVEQLDRTLRRKLRGQDLAIETLVRGLRRRAAGFAQDTKRPYSALLVGPTGTGKTEMAETTAKALDYRIQRYDLGGADETLAWTHLGSPRGFVGSEKGGGTLSSALQSDPAQVLLFDEVEKAGPRFFDVLMTLIDEGRVKDRTTDQYVRCGEAISFFTSNMMVDTAELQARPDRARDLVLETHVFRPEFVNRLSDVIPFAPLTLLVIREIAFVLITALLDRVRKKHELAVRVDRRVVDAIVVACDLKFGARDVGRRVDHMVGDRLSDALTQVPNARSLDLRVEGGEIIVEASP